MKKLTIPIGESEGDQLEFKGARELDALHKGKSDLGRSVVAMLNGNGGAVWIGVREQSGRATAMEAVERPRDQWEAIWNHLLTTIEPPIQAGDVEPEVVSAPEGEVLVLRVRTGPQKPYAFHRQGGRRYFVRAGARIRDLTREEILTLARSGAEASESAVTAKAEEAFTVRRQKLTETRERLFWLRAMVVSTNGSRSLVEFDITNPSVRALLTDPLQTKTREYAMASHLLVPKRDTGVLRAGTMQFGCVEIGRSGYVDITVPLARFADRSANEEKDDEGRQLLVLHPLLWIEHVVFGLRLVREMFAIHAAKPKEPHSLAVLAEIALLNARDVKLFGYSPRTYGYMFRHDSGVVKGDHLLIDGPLRFELADITAHADRCARLLMLRAYESFGLEEKHLPAEWDPETLEFKSAS